MHQSNGKKTVILVVNYVKLLKCLNYCDLDCNIVCLRSDPGVKPRFWTRAFFLLHNITSSLPRDFMCILLCMCFAFKCDSLNLVVFQLVFEALHSQEPRGYVVGWIIAISLLVGILIFLLLSVLLWKVIAYRNLDFDFFSQRVVCKN